MSAHDRLPTLFIPHGGGPCFFLEPGEGFPPGTWDRMGAYLRGIGATVGARPKTLLVISGHWTEARPTIYAPAEPALLYDYYGFPERTYRLQYPVPGDTRVAAQVKELLGAAGMSCGENTTRGFDHGVFIPLMLVYPQADIPIVQLSLMNGYDPEAHMAMGRALAPLREQGVLMIGSGLSYHNLRAFGSPAQNAAAGQFDDWLNDAVTTPDPAERERKLAAWKQAPGARAAHPTEEHLAPLFIAVGAAGADRGWADYRDEVFGKANSGFRFGNRPE